MLAVVQRGDLIQSLTPKGIVYTKVDILKNVGN